MMKARFLTCLILIFTCFYSQAQWTAVPLGTSGNVNGISYYGSNEIWIVSAAGLHKSSNNGTSFVTYPLQMSSGLSWLQSQLNDVAVVGANTAVGAGFFFLGNDEFIVRTTDGGAHWDSVLWTPNTFLAEFRTTAFPTTTTGFIAGWQGRIFKTLNGGVSWSSVYTNPSVTFNDMYFSSPTNGVVVGDNIIVRTTNGSTFTTAFSFSGTLEAVGFSGNTGYAGGNTTSGPLFKTTNGGSTWTPIQFPYGDIRSLAVLSADTLVAATLNTLYKSTDGGAYWDEFILPAGATPQFNDVKFRDSNTGYAGGNNGYCISTSNGGGNTRPIASFTSPSGSFCQSQSYNFTNTANPAYAFQWLVNGTQVATTYNLNYNFSTGGATAVSLVAFNGVNYDTLTQNITVAPEHFVNAPTLDTDTICPGLTASVLVLNSQSGISYQLRNGFTPIGSAQTGNGNTLTIPIGTINVTTSYNIKASGTNACYTDSLITPFFQVAFPDKSLPTTVTDSAICSGTEHFQIIVNNTQPGVWYKLTRLSAVLDSIAGNGGTITLQAPFAYGTNQTTNYILRAYQNASCNPIMRNVPATIDTVYARPYTNTPNVFPGQTIQFLNNSYGDSYQWTFPPQANIQTSTLSAPSISISTPGQYSVSTVVSNNEGCTDTLFQNVYVNAVSPTGITTYCGSTQINPSLLTPYDSHIDENKNLYIAGSYAGSFNPERIAFVSKTDSNGVLKWTSSAINWSTSNQAVATGVTTDDMGNVYVAGSFSGSRIFFDTLTFTGDTLNNLKGFLVKYDSEGHAQWLIKGLPQNNQAPGCWFGDVEKGANGQLFVSGNHAAGIIRFPNGTTHTSTGTNGSTFILTIDTSGNFVNYESFGPTSGGATIASPNSQINNTPRLEKTANGNLMIVSAFAPTAGNMQTAFGPQSFSDTTTTIFISTKGPSGNWINTKKGPSGGIRTVVDATTDNNGVTYVNYLARQSFITGTTITELDVNNANATPVYYIHSVISSVGSSGTFNWSRHTRFSSITGISLNPNGELLFSAIVPDKGNVQTSSGVPQGFNSAGLTDYVVGKYNSQGDLLFANSLGTAQHDFAFDVVTDNCGDLYVPIIENRSQASGWPQTTGTAGGGTFSVLKLSKDGFCRRGPLCTGITNTFSEDASVTRIVLSDTLVSPGPTQVIVRLKNMATNVLQNAQIRVSANGTNQINYVWTGSLSSYAASDSINLGTMNISVPGTYLIKAWADLPNGNTDQNHQNDTAYAQIEICGPLAGSYTIGSGGDFESFSSAVKQIKTCGLSGPVTFNVLPGVYTDRLIMNNLPTTASDSIIFQSSTNDSSDVVMQCGVAMPYQNGIVVISNSGYITLRSLTFRNLDHDNSVNMVISTGGTNPNLNIHNCVIERLNPDTTASDILYYQSNSTNNNLSIKNNLFYQGSKAMNVVGTHTGTVIKNNRYINQTSSGITFQGTLNPIISENYFETNYHVNNSYIAVSSSSAPQGFLIEKNKVVVNNGNGYGFGLGSACGAGTPGWLVNNMVSVTNSYEYSIGVQFGSSASNINVYHNTVLLEGTSNNSSGMYFSGNSMTNIDVRNNIFDLRDNGFVMWYTGTYPASVNTNYNCYHTNGSVFARNATLPFGTVNHPTLASWQSFSGDDANSVFHNPNFVSSTDLHIPANGVINGSGTSLPSVTFDFDGDLRNALTPDMGCDEFANPDTVTWPGDCNYDGVANNYDALSLGLYFNQTGTPRNNASLNWTAQPSNDWGSAQYCGFDKKHADTNGDGIINFADTTAINLNWGQSHPLRQLPPITRMTSGPELYFVPLNDTVAAGDTALIELHMGTATLPTPAIYGLAFDIDMNQSIAVPGSITLTYPYTWFGTANINAITTANVGSMVSGSLVRTNGQDTAGYGPFALLSFIVTPSLAQSQPIALSFANYLGLTASGSSLSFTDIADTLVLVNSSGINDHNTIADVFPNPASDDLWIELRHEHEGFLQLTDLSGRIVIEQSINPFDKNIHLSTKGLQNGVYLLRIMSADENGICKVVIRR